MKNRETGFYHIGKNVVNSNQIMGYDKRNWLEAFLFAGCVIFIISLIPFVRDIKIVVTIFFSILTFFFGLIGIKDRSITEIIIAERKFRKKKRKLHLRSVDYAREKGAYYEGSDTSILERYTIRIKSSIDKFVEENSSE